jgi:DNA polymerase-3 subunit chi
MTERVDFYVLKTATETERWRLACRLAEKAYLIDLRVLVLSETLADAKAIDDLLWTFDERSFVPHRLRREDSAAAAAAPVEILADAAGAPPADLLVNLANRPPGELERFARIAEIVDADQERRRLGRERFKFYRDLKIPLETHQLDATMSI